MMQTLVRRTSDFKVTGSGKAKEWQKAEWLAIPPLKGKAPGYATRAKLLYSDAGIYVLFDCEDRKLVTTMTRDGDDLWREDVVEIFLQPNPKHPFYFEYEISPINYQLSLLIANNKGTFFGWQAWKDVGARGVRRATAARGGKKKSKAKVTGWSAEFFVPYELLRGMTGVPPKPGSVWRGNLYRIDHDSGKAVHFAWSKPSKPNFHQYQRFGFLRFE
jgi:hypothetical protein